MRGYKELSHIKTPVTFITLESAAEKQDKIMNTSASHHCITLFLLHT